MNDIGTDKYMEIGKNKRKKKNYEKSSYTSKSVISDAIEKKMSKQLT